MGYDPIRPAQRRAAAGERQVKAGERGSIMLDILIGLLLATVGLCLILGSIALTSQNAGRVEQDTLKIIQTRNEKAKAELFEITPETFKK